MSRRDCRKHTASLRGNFIEDKVAYKDKEKAKECGRRFYQRHRAEIAAYDRERNKNLAPEQKERKRERDRAYYAANRERILEKKKEYTATHREQRKNYLATHAEQRKQAHREWARSHRAYLNARMREWRKRNRDSVKESNRKFRQNHPDAVQEHHKRYYREHRQEVLQRSKEYAKQHRAQIAEYERKYCKSHPERNATKYIERRAREKATIDDLTTRDIKTIKSFGCFFCGSKTHLTIAHDIPVAKKGNTTRANTFCLCSTCNAMMKTYTLSEMLEQQLLPLD
jgi:hypothetical protein